MSEQVKRYKILSGMPDTALLFLPADVVAASDYDALEQRCRNLEAVQQAGLECSGRIKAAAGALGWTADREDGPLEFLIEQAQRCRELEQRLLSLACRTAATGWSDAKQRRELDDCLSRGIAATEGERDTLRAEVERYKAQVIEEAGKVLSLADELAKLRRWEKEVRENSPLLIRLEAAENERDVLRGLLAECAEYLNTNNLTSIGHGSILHRKMIDAGMEAPR